MLIWRGKETNKHDEVWEAGVVFTKKVGLCELAGAESKLA